MEYPVVSCFTQSLDTPLGNTSYTTLFHPMTRAECTLTSNFWNRVVRNDPELLDSPVLAELVKQGFLVPAGTDEFQLFCEWRSDLARSYETIKSRVLVTRECDNRCRYCAVKRKAISMSAETAWAMDMAHFDLIIRKKPSRVQDVYLGGEPLLNLPVLEASAQRRFIFCSAREIPYAFAITTNGNRLRPEVVSRLKRYGLASVHVSISGPEDVHNRLRPPAVNGGGSPYRALLERLADVSRLVPIEIEYQYDTHAEDYARIGEMIADFIHYGIQVANIAVSPILPGRGDHHFEGGMGDPGMTHLINNILNEAGFPVYQDPPILGCATDLKNYRVYDADGSILPCVVLQLGEMAYGRVETGVDFVAETQLLKRRFPEECQSCDLLPACMGGCRLQAMIRNGDFNGVFCTYDHLKMSLENYMRHLADGNLKSMEIPETPARCD